MKNILLINPNTNGQITHDLKLLAESVCGDHAHIVSRTASFGASYIADHVSLAIAGHAVLDAYADALNDGIVADAILIGCFGDPGFEALAQLAGIPVVGFAESGIRAAATMPGSFLVGTRGEVWREILQSLVHRLGLGSRLAEIVALPDGVNDPVALARSVEEAAARTGAARIVLGGAGLMHVIADVGRASRLPIIDAHRTAIVDAVDRAGKAPPADRAIFPGVGMFTGLSPALTSLLAK